MTLLSMTGFGEARLEQDGLSLGVEVRSINSRFFKLSTRAPEGYAPVEPRIESLVRKFVSRGSVQVSLRVVQESSADDFQIDPVVLGGYYRQLNELSGELGAEAFTRLDALLTLPGVMVERQRASSDVEQRWPLVQKTLTTALERLRQMRQEEGRAMAQDLLEKCADVAAQLTTVEQRAPLVVEVYRQRLTERLNKLLGEHEINIEPRDIVREVGIFADRCDISEETVRLRSHLAQFEAIMKESQSGKKLEFLIQEMFREINTIGSKANNAEIAACVIEMKSAVERMREMVQNVE